MKIINRLNQLISDTIDHITGAEQPKLYYHNKSQLQVIVNNIEQLQHKYRPTPWLFNTHLQLLYFDLFKKKLIKLDYDRVDILDMDDQGKTAIYWLGYDLPSEIPTIVILHTITGTPSSMRELVRDLHQHTGWRVALCVRRGHAELEFPVPQFNLFGSVSDLKQQLDYIQSHFPQSDLYGVGSSAGSGLLVRYLGEEAEKAYFKAAFAFCPGYNTEIGFEKVHPIYSQYMAKKLLKTFVYKYIDSWKHIENLEEILASKNLTEFHLRYYKLAGFKNYKEYSLATNPMHVFKNIKIPLMVLNSQDDPVCHIDNFEPYMPEILNLPSIVVVTTKKGSHCAFYEGWTPQSWASRLISSYFLKHHQHRELLDI